MAQFGFEHLVNLAATDPVAVDRLSPPAAADTGLFGDHLRHAEAQRQSAQPEPTLHEPSDDASASQTGPENQPAAAVQDAANAQAPDPAADQAEQDRPVGAAAPGDASADKPADTGQPDDALQQAEEAPVRTQPTGLAAAGNSSGVESDLAAIQSRADSAHAATLAGDAAGTVRSTGGHQTAETGPVELASGPGTDTKPHVVAAPVNPAEGERDGPPTDALADPDLVADPDSVADPDLDQGSGQVPTGASSEAPQRSHTEADAHRRASGRGTAESASPPAEPAATGADASSAEAAAGLESPVLGNAVASTTIVADADLSAIDTQQGPEAVRGAEPSAAATAVRPARGQPATPVQNAAPAADGADSVETARFVQRVARALVAGQRQAGQELRLRLHPPELGHLRLQVRLQDGVLTARMEAETHAARTLLLDHLPVLRDRLGQHDIKIERFDVDLMQQPAGGSHDRSAADARPDRRGTPPPPNPDGRKAGRDEQPVVRRPRRAFDDGQLNVVI